ncbi:hypothetical protein B0H16DRAFT_1422533 [Mycena metata]|uniref:Uncharacterized protein n=1 Tax=Mycena metata TaxID=1033252 RepID=A0AAD7IJ91_9AGAR|nr:hypothetical protein B0H16DRAFT_1422533 [Mycena metata]
MSQSAGGSKPLPPDLQKQILVSAYVFAGSTAVFVWDILNNLRNDYSLLFRHRLNAATLAYFASSTQLHAFRLEFCLLLRIRSFDCNTAYIAFDIFLAIGVSGAAFLCFLRVRAIFQDERIPTIVFGCLWLAVPASSINSIISVGAVGLGDPTVCVFAPRYGTATYGLAGIVLMVYDTIVFLAISYRLISNFQAEQQTPGEQIKALFSGAELPAFPKSLFMDGQMYYMIAVAANIVTTVMAYVRVTPIYRGFLVIPNITLTSIMACRIYRHTKLGVTHRSADLTLPTLNTLGASGNTIPLRVVPFSGQHTGIVRELHPGVNDSDPTEHDESGTDIQLHLTRGKSSNYSSQSNVIP